MRLAGRLFPLVSLFSLLSAGPADAQIYVARDEHGTLVLSDRPLGAGSVTYAVPRASSVLTTRPASRHARDYDELIEAASGRHQVRADLVRAVIQVESGFNRFARSRKGAMGLMQLMPATAATHGVRDPYDPGENITAGVAYLRHLIDRYEGSEELALAAYNAGPTAVDRYGRRVPPYAETRDYVRRVRQTTSVTGGLAPKPVIYRTTQVIDGREVPLYTNVKPTSGEFEIVAGAR